ncbi:MAG: response regulator, partial [Myxococcales bacterium]
MELPLRASVVVIGEPDLARPLEEAFEVHTTTLNSGLEVVLAKCPDVVLVDADLEGIGDFVERLLEDSDLPVVAIASLPDSSHHARLLALGIHRLVPRLASPSSVVQACQEALEVRNDRTYPMVPSREPTLEELGDLLASEVRRALVDDVPPASRHMTVPIESSTEVLGALWGAIARVQDVVRATSGVRFRAEGPEGAIPFAPSILHAPPERRGAPAEADRVDLVGRRVLVADDDPGVTWFLSDLLRSEGCNVCEALDGQSALDLALRIGPDLIVSDVLMPGLDGFSLCRALKRDVALRDVPVVLLSWKEDLLQRMREIGANAQAYLAKKSDARVMLTRVREALWPRVSLEARLRSHADIQGRTEGLTPCLLLDLTCALRPSSRVQFREGTTLWEVELRGGAPVRARQEGLAGTVEEGERAFARLLGVRGGRFFVSESNAPVTSNLEGSLGAQLAEPISRARRCPRWAWDERTECVGLDPAAASDAMATLGADARALVRLLDGGTSPRLLLVEHNARLVEDLVADLAARAAILSVLDLQGSDLLDRTV